MFDLKFLDLIGRLSKKDLTIELKEGKFLEYKTPKKVSISHLFFRDGQCKRCGRSCNVGFNLYWTENEYIDFIYDYTFKRKLIPISIRINGKEKHLFKYENPTSKTSWCKLVLKNSENYTCGIHDIKPIHCSLPPIQIDQRYQRTILTKRLFGRNFKFGCEVQWEPFNRKFFEEWDLPQLKRLRDSSHYLEVDTWLDEIINYFEKKTLKEEEIPTSSIVIYEKK